MTLHTRNDGADAALGPGSLGRHWRLWPFALIACDLGLIAVRAARYPPFFSMPGAPAYLIEPVAALAVYALGICLLPYLTARAPDARMALRVGTVAGLVGGAIEVANTALESLWTLPQHIVGITTGIAMLALFLTFGVAGYIGGQRAHSFGLGIVAALWCAIVAILIVVTFGFILVNTSLTPLAHDEIADPDYLRSGWTDVRAFAIANTYDAGFTHLVEAPVIAAVLGAVGSGAGRVLQFKQRPPEVLVNNKRTIEEGSEG